MVSNSNKNLRYRADWGSLYDVIKFVLRYRITVLCCYISLFFFCFVVSLNRLRYTVLRKLKKNKGLTLENSHSIYNETR